MLLLSLSIAIRELLCSLENVSFTSIEEDKQDYQEELLLDFPDEERGNIFKVRIVLWK